MAIVVMGAGSGGVDALSTILGALPRTFPAPICVVQHTRFPREHLVERLGESTELVVEAATHGAELEAGRVYVAPFDMHLRVSGRRLDVSRGPKENFSRPAIDPLFRSAAESCGSGVIAVLLTGRLNDGTAGLFDVKRRGGLAMVQTPESASSPDMPRSALTHVVVDHCVPLTEMAERLLDVVGTRPAEASSDRHDSQEPVPFVAPVALTCPDCGGAMRRTQLGTLAMFECHTGHRFTSDAVVQGAREGIDAKVDELVRRLNEVTARCSASLGGTTDAQEVARQRAAARRSVELRDALVALFESGWMETSA